MIQPIKWWGSKATHILGTDWVLVVFGIGRVDAIYSSCSTANFWEFLCFLQRIIKPRVSFVAMFHGLHCIFFKWVVHEDLGISMTSTVVFCSRCFLFRRKGKNLVPKGEPRQRQNTFAPWPEGRSRIGVVPWYHWSITIIIYDHYLGEYLPK